MDKAVSSTPNAVLGHGPGGTFSSAGLEEEHKAEGQPTKSEVDGQHPSSHYLVVEDPQKPTTWHLRVYTVDGKPDRGLMGAAHAALTVGYRGNKYEGPGKQAALSKLNKMYGRAGAEMPTKEKAYRLTTKPGDKWASLKRPDVYEALRKRGYDKESAARISNAMGSKEDTAREAAKIKADALMKLLGVSEKHLGSKHNQQTHGNRGGAGPGSNTAENRRRRAANKPAGGGQTGRLSGNRGESVRGVKLSPHGKAKGLPPKGKTITVGYDKKRGDYRVSYYNRLYARGSLDSVGRLARANGYKLDNYSQRTLGSTLAGKITGQAAKGFDPNNAGADVGSMPRNLRADALKGVAAARLDAVRDVPLDPRNLRSTQSLWSESNKALPQTARALLESRIHRAYTVTADELFGRGYLDRDKRLEIGRRLGDLLTEFGKGLVDDLQLDKVIVDADDVHHIAKIKESVAEKHLAGKHNQDTHGNRGGTSGGGGAHASGRATGSHGVTAENANRKNVTEALLKQRDTGLVRDMGFSTRLQYSGTSNQRDMKAMLSSLGFKPHSDNLHMVLGKVMAYPSSGSMSNRYRPYIDLWETKSKEVRMDNAGADVPLDPRNLRVKALKEEVAARLDAYRSVPSNPRNLPATQPQWADRVKEEAAAEVLKAHDPATAAAGIFLFEVTKHLGGKHNQQTHGGWATGKGGARDKRIAAERKRGGGGAASGGTSGGKKPAAAEGKRHPSLSHDTPTGAAPRSGRTATLIDPRGLRSNDYVQYPGKRWTRVLAKWVEGGNMNFHVRHTDGTPATYSVSLNQTLIAQRGKPAGTRAIPGVGR